jgi:hypothetical protein
VGFLYDINELRNFLLRQVPLVIPRHATDSAKENLKPVYKESPLAKMPEAVQKLLDSKVVGRLFVDINSQVMSYRCHVAGYAGATP